MAYNPQPGSSSQSFSNQSFARYGDPARFEQHADPPFDVLEWYPHFQSCHRYFLDHAQHSGPVQALAAFMNIQLPCQKQTNPVLHSPSSSPRSAGLDVGGPPLRQPSPYGPTPNAAYPQAVSLIPYIRRLIATGNDTHGVLHGFFGDDWVAGIGKLHEMERRNYLFAAKSTNWLQVKKAYDMSPEETVPFLCPLKSATLPEIQQAESEWSKWLAMQDWMLGPREPEQMNSRQIRIKREPRE